ncbi:CD99 molecule (Xg blood group) [Phyllostomus discolor]|uniref:CD99 antigen isoform X2 n=1 Tax=Phyllostomus discolor TaxID=89673 RepID=A0A7E6D2D2_9CHIR|nr:CD99 antigen isoform X2 [Phyllostomus discolor]KAF6090154.1 CD99 molecule (Xg blood group) [Phyllostomus discolor]
MARRAVLALLLFCLLNALVSAQDDFDLSDAVDDTEKIPTPTPKKPTSGDDFTLEDALPGGGHDDPMRPGPPKPKPNPNPHHPGSSGGFSDSDLVDQTSGGGEPQGVVPGIIGAVVVAVAGAISSFIAYQKKKLCFKENTDQADINMETNRTVNAEPLVQQTIIEK